MFGIHRIFSLFLFGQGATYSAMCAAVMIKSTFQAPIHAYDVTRK
ncbi:MAG: hypothetical protein ACJA0W_004071 [Candidatus Azotimanducaceae bacterium]